MSMFSKNLFKKSKVWYNHIGEIMETKKTKSRAKLNADNFNTKTKKPTKSQVKKATKKVQSLGLKGLTICLIFLLVGALVGAGAYFITSKNDCFELLGNDEISLQLGEQYVENGVKIVEFGQDISDSVIIETDLDLNNENKPTTTGTFYIKYTTSSFKYGKLFRVQKIRLVTVVDTSEGGE